MTRALRREGRCERGTAGRCVAALPLILALANAILLAGCLRGGEERAAQPQEACAEPPPRFVGTLVAGSGANLPLVRLLLDDLVAAGEVRVAESIGSSGAVAALRDGAIDVGLLSRPLREREHSATWSVVPIASSPVVWAAHPGVGGPEGVEVRLLQDIYAGRVGTWPSGTPAVPIVREAGDSGLEVLRQTWPELVAEVDAARERGFGLLAITDAEARQMLEQVPGAVGPTDLGMLSASHSPAVPLVVGGIDPSALPRRTLSLVYESARRTELEPVLDRLAGARAVPTLVELGYAPPSARGRP